MPETKADIVIRATTEDYISWQVLKEDGTTAISLAGADSVTLRLKNKLNDTVTEFKTTDNPQKLFVTDAANGKFELRPAAGDFPSESSYDFHIIVTDSIGNHPVPENKNYTLRVIDDYAPA